METKYVRVPFEIELAKKITNKEIEGRIVTKHGKIVRIICWDRKCVDYPIVALIDYAEKGENFWFYTTEGKTPYQTLNLILEIPEYMTFKDGDIIFLKLVNSEDAWVFVYNSREGKTGSYISFEINSGFLDFGGYITDDYDIKYIRYANKEEISALIERLKKSKRPGINSMLKRFFGIEENKEYEFKPFDKVLVRVSKDCTWNADFYSYYDDRSKTYICIGSVGKYCIPYKGNEHLLGTIEDVSNN